MTPADGGERWGAQLEIYLTDPEQEPDMSKWHTELAFGWPTELPPGGSPSGFTAGGQCGLPALGPRPRAHACAPLTVVH